MDLQSLCHAGQQALVATDYLTAERALAQAEQIAWANHDFDTLARLYMPLQEAHRQIRLRAGEGVVCLDLLAQGPDDDLRADHVMQNIPHGQVLVAGWGTIRPAVELRKLAHQHELYLETFLAAVYPIGDTRAVVIVPHADLPLPDPTPRTLDELAAKLPANCLIIPAKELPVGQHKGTPETFSRVSALWERLHAPFLATADAQTDPLRKIEAYRKTIQVDSACELAHQHLSDTARGMRAGK